MSEVNLVKEWFRFAHNDLIVAKHSFEDLHPKQIEIACFHCQQSAEKALKGYLLFHQFDPPKTHDLVVLYKLCLKRDDSFKEIANLCAVLTPYGVTVRYPKEIAVDEILTKSAIQKAQTIYDFCRAKIPELNES